MKNEFSKRFLLLQLFAEGGEGGDASGSGTEGATGENGAGVADLIATKKGANKNPLADVKYGKQVIETPTEPDVATAEDKKANDKPIDRNAEFEKLIKGDYKDLYDAKVQGIVQSRLKNAKDIESKYNTLSPMLEMLGKKYGVNPSDVEALNKAIEEDDSYYEDEALERGMSVQELKNVRKMERENASLKAQITEQQNRAKAEQDVSVWMKQAEEAKKTYPGLDLNQEIQNEQFVKLLKSGIDVGTAYFVLHKDDIMPQTMQYVAKQTEQRVANKIMSQGSRPVENATSTAATAIVKDDPRLLTKEDRAEIARRVARGEKISF